MNEQPLIQIRIRDLRRERSLTQEELAQGLGISRQSINAMEAGRCMPSLPIALQIADFFSVPVNMLFELEKEIEAEMERQLKIHENLQNDHSPQTDQQAEHLSYKEVYQPNLKRQEADMTTLIPWTPLREMRSMLDEMMDETAFMPNTVQLTVPAVNISQTVKDVKLEMRLPGFEKDDLSIEVGEDFITVNGDVKSEKESTSMPVLADSKDKKEAKPKSDSKELEPRQYFRREFTHNTFSRTMALPAVVDASKAEAEMKHGILHITVPKMIEEKPKTAKITVK